MVRRCEMCGSSTGSTDRRKKFCSPRCRKAAWAARHPRVTIELPETPDNGGPRFKFVIELQVSARRVGE